MSGGSVPNDRTQPIRGGRVIDIAAANDTLTGVALSTRAIYVGVSGDLKVDTVDGSTLTFVGLLDVSIVPVHARMVYKAGTTCDAMLALW